MREVFTSSVRYTENKLRALIGVKSRLAVRDLDEKYKRIIDGYFSEIVSNAAKKRVYEVLAEYEKFYEAPAETFSSKGADEIEKASWDTTIRLVSEEEKNELLQEQLEQNEVCADKINVDNEEACCDERYGLSDMDVEKIGIALSEGFYDDSAAERINEAFYENFGDVILEFNGNVYVVIEDYREEIYEWLGQMK